MVRGVYKSKLRLSLELASLVVICVCKTRQFAGKPLIHPTTAGPQAATFHYDTHRL